MPQSTLNWTIDDLDVVIEFDFTPGDLGREASLDDPGFPAEGPEIEITRVTWETVDGEWWEADGELFQAVVRESQLGTALADAIAERANEDDLEEREDAAYDKWCDEGREDSYG